MGNATFLGFNEFSRNYTVQIFSIFWGHWMGVGNPLEGRFQLGLGPQNGKKSKILTTILSAAQTVEVTVPAAKHKILPV